MESRKLSREVIPVVVVSIYLLLACSMTQAFIERRGDVSEQIFDNNISDFRFPNTHCTCFIQNNCSEF